jgi:hypothetical protein
VRIAASSAKKLRSAVQLFLSRVSAAGITLNASDGRQPLDEGIFLGELYAARGRGVSNSPFTVEKLRQAWSRLEASFDEAGQQVSSGTVTVRHLAAFFSLILYMTNTLDVPMCELRSLVRAYSAIARDAALRSEQDGSRSPWEQRATFLDPRLRTKLAPLVQRLIDNVPVPLPVLRPPPVSTDECSALVMVDASQFGAGAVIHFPAQNKTVHYRRRWSSPLADSAHAEPCAVVGIFKFIDSVLKDSNERSKPVAIVTDHQAMVSGQRRWFSGYGGSSLSYWLNSAYCSAYSWPGGAEFFFVPGDLNTTADRLSRSLASLPADQDIVSVSPTEAFTCPLGSIARHPFAGPPPVEGVRRGFSE